MVTLSSKTICDLLNLYSSWNTRSDTGIYSISCKDYKLKYIGEMARNIPKPLYEHKRDIRLGNLNNTGRGFSICPLS